ncbi:putative Major facilitator superfamily domain-containing protein [Seiridium cardinale]|uniref:Major facilitator superfamily domain-containing protein n=1 Tax=Seiridium cardinale TaxID=138064 RepID=A0ABR2Y394_9PEZI
MAWLTANLRFDSHKDTQAVLGENQTNQVAVIRPKPDGDLTRVTWMSLPRKGQLAIITLTRLSEPLARTSSQAYMFYYLKWLDPSSSDSEIAFRTAILNASFTAAQLLTGVLWGYLADSPRLGRKTVILMGLIGTFISCMGYGFSTTFYSALLFRIIGGLTNGNGGVIRTMISEVVQEKVYQSRAFLLLPIAFNIGSILGPSLGGILADPGTNYPGLFGDVEFFQRLPYATPSILVGLLNLISLLLSWLYLEETLESRIGRHDWGREVASWLSNITRRSLLRGTSKKSNYMSLPSYDYDTEMETFPLPSTHHAGRQPSSSAEWASKELHTPRYTQRLSFTRIFTPNVLLNLGASFLLSFHGSSFNTLWPIFLATPVYDPTKAADIPIPVSRQLPFFFTGGLGLQPQEIGKAMVVFGVFGILLQLWLYPRLSARLGQLGSLRIFALLFPVTYFLAPYLSLVPAVSPPPHAKNGGLVWICIAAILFLQVLGRTFVQPAQTVLINNSSPHPSVLGTVHGLAQSTNSLGRTIGSMLCGYFYGLGLDSGVVGAVWWGLSAVSILMFITSLWILDGNGHEIWLEGEEESAQSHGSKRAVITAK